MSLNRLSAESTLGHSYLTALETAEVTLQQMTPAGNHPLENRAVLEATSASIEISRKDPNHEPTPETDQPDVYQYVGQFQGTNSHLYLQVTNEDLPVVKIKNLTIIPTEEPIPTEEQLNYIDISPENFQVSDEKSKVSKNKQRAKELSSERMADSPQPSSTEKHFNLITQLNKIREQIAQIEAVLNWEKDTVNNGMDEGQTQKNIEMLSTLKAQEARLIELLTETDEKQPQAVNPNTDDGLYENFAQARLSLKSLLDQVLHAPSDDEAIKLVIACNDINLNQYGLDRIITLVQKVRREQQKSIAPAILVDESLTHAVRPAKLHLALIKKASAMRALLKSEDGKTSNPFLTQYQAAIKLWLTTFIDSITPTSTHQSSTKKYRFDTRLMQSAGMIETAFIPWFVRHSSSLSPSKFEPFRRMIQSAYQGFPSRVIQETGLSIFSDFPDLFPVSPLLLLIDLKQSSSYLDLVASMMQPFSDIKTLLTQTVTFDINNFHQCFDMGVSQLLRELRIAGLSLFSHKRSDQYMGATDTWKPISGNPSLRALALNHNKIVFGRNVHQFIDMALTELLSGKPLTLSFGGKRIELFDPVQGKVKDITIPQLVDSLSNLVTAETMPALTKIDRLTVPMRNEIIACEKANANGSLREDQLALINAVVATFPLAATAAVDKCINGTI